METMETPTKKRKVYIHLIRHATSLVNFPATATKAEVKLGRALLDPGLSSRGYDEAMHLRHRFPYMKDLTYIFTSPLDRALLTTIFALKPAINSGIKPIVLAELRETGRGPNSTGNAAFGILKGSKGSPDYLNTDMLAPGWEVNTEQKGDSADRADKVKEMLKELTDVLASQDTDPTLKKLNFWKDFTVSPLNNGKDVHIAVVSHANFLEKMVGKPNWWDKGYFKNAEFRTYEFRGFNEFNGVGRGGRGGPLLGGQKTSDMFETDESQELVHPSRPTKATAEKPKASGM